MLYLLLFEPNPRRLGILPRMIFGHPKIISGNAKRDFDNAVSKGRNAYFIC